MIGPRGLAEALGAHLNVEVPAAVDRLAVELGVVVDDPFKGEELVLDAQPALIAMTQISIQQAYDNWPFIIISVGRMLRQRRFDVDNDARALYERVYRTRIYVWARGDGYHYTAAVRDRLVLAVGEALLRAQTFGTPDGWAKVIETAWTEEYSEAGDDEDLGTVAPAYIETEFACYEWLTAPRDPLGEADTIRITVRPLTHADEPDTPTLPPHPALQ